MAGKARNELNLDLALESMVAFRECTREWGGFSDLGIRIAVKIRTDRR